MSNGSIELTVKFLEGRKVESGSIAAAHQQAMEKANQAARQAIVAMQTELDQTLKQERGDVPAKTDQVIGISTKLYHALSNFLGDDGFIRAVARWNKENNKIRAKKGQAPIQRQPAWFDPRAWPRMGSVVDKNAAELISLTKHISI